MTDSWIPANHWASVDGLPTQPFDPERARRLLDEAGFEHLLATGEIPDTSYFSFLSPPRTWVDYYWLFQALVYSLYEAAGYGGLEGREIALPEATRERPRREFLAWHGGRDN